jgi:activator-of-BECN1-regulated-autophagy protein 1
VSVSLSPTCQHLLVGLASRRVALLPTDRHTIAQIFQLEGGLPGRTIGARGRLSHIRDIVQDREQGYMSLNCIRWAPGPGQGLVYGTNTGKLKLLR